MQRLKHVKKLRELAQWTISVFDGTKEAFNCFECTLRAFLERGVETSAENQVFCRTQYTEHVVDSAAQPLEVYQIRRRQVVDQRLNGSNDGTQFRQVGCSSAKVIEVSEQLTD